MFIACSLLMCGITRQMLTASCMWERAWQAKGADGMQLCVVDCIAYIVDAETDECLLAYE